MANSTTLLKYSLKTNIVKSIYFEIISKISRYYYTFGKSTPWPTITAVDSSNQTYTVSSEEDPPAASESYPYELQTRKDMIYMKAIDTNDVAIVVPRRNWSAGMVYDMYDDYSADFPSYSGAASLDQSTFYVLTNDFNVYKCLFNNNNGLSVVQPTGNSTEATALSDGYIWKFMYSIPLSLRNKFLTTSHMPVVTALTNQFYSNGSITTYNIENKGAAYIPNAWSVKRIVILNSGAGYVLGDIAITFPDPEEGSDTATAEVSDIGEGGNVISIAITNPGSGYTTQPIPTISKTVGAGLDYFVEYDKDPSAYTELKVIGDGYNEYNPYSLKKINIRERGVFTSVPQGSLFTFPAADFKYGYMPEVQVNFREIQGSNPTAYEVDTIEIISEGYGYANPLVFGENVFAGPLVSDDSGFNCDLDFPSQKNEAELIPLINSSGEIEAIQITNPGIGYTYASVQVISKKMVEMVPGDPYSAIPTDLSSDNTEGFVKASVLLDFGVGDIDTKQSNVELLAVDGSIPVVNIDFGGAGYPSNTTLTVVGDGSGCVISPTIIAGKITAIDVINPGSGYTTATVTINGAGVGAQLRPIISPKGGHGKDAITELFARTIAFTGRISIEKNKGVEVSNDYRQICILKNPMKFNADTYYRNSTGSTCILLTCEADSANAITYNLLELDDTLYYDQNRTFTLIEKAYTNNKYYLVLQVNDNFIPLNGSSVYKNVDADSYSISAITVENPDINKFSGELLYIDNRIKFASTEEQSIVTTTLISF